MTDRAPAPADVEATLAAVIRRAQMVPYEDGKGGWLWRSASADEIAAALLASPALATLRAHERACDHTELPDTMWPRLRSAEAASANRLALLRAVVSYVDTNNGDLPLTLLDSIRAEIGGPR